ncbi:MAG: hypothetical protein ABSH10_07980 [Phycisphaerae bacterium]|jgi:hypothetical protein
MEPNEQQSERIARWLDGREGPLGAAELSEARRLRRQEERLGRRLDIPVPPAALAAAEMTLRRAVARSRRRSVLRIVLEVAAAAAAAVLVIAMLWPQQASTSPSDVPTAVLFEASPQNPNHIDLGTIAAQVNQVKAQMLASVPPMPQEGLAEGGSDEEDPDAAWQDEWFEELSS